MVSVDKFLRVHGIIVKSRPFGNDLLTSATLKTPQTSWCNGADCEVIKRMVVSPVNPQPVEKNCKSSGNGDNGSLLFRPPRSNIRVPQRLRSLPGPKRPTDIEHRTSRELLIAGLAYSELLFDRAGLVAVLSARGMQDSGMGEPAGVRQRSN